MLGYLNGLGRAKKSSGSTNRTVTKKKTILKKAFSVLPPVMAIKLAKQVIAKNKSLPRSASQNTQHRALKQAVAQAKAKQFVRKNKTMFLDDADLTEAPAMEQNIEDAQIEAEVENEIEQEQEFADDQADLGIYYPTSIGDKASRKAKKEAKIDKKKAKTEKIRAKSQLKIDKGQAKKDRAVRPRGSLKDVSSSILDTVKQGAGIYKDIKGGGSGSSDESLPAQPTGESFFAKNKTLLILGGVALFGGAFLLMRKKK